MRQVNVLAEELVVEALEELRGAGSGGGKWGEGGGKGDHWCR